MPRPNPELLKPLGHDVTPEKVEAKRRAILQLFQAVLEDIANGENGDPKELAREALSHPWN